MNFHYEVGQRFLETNGKHDAEWTIDTANAAFKKEAIKKAGQYFSEFSKTLKEPAGYKLFYWWNPDHDHADAMRKLGSIRKTTTVYHDIIEYRIEDTAVGTGTYSGTIRENGDVTLSEDAESAKEVVITNIKSVPLEVEMYYFFAHESVSFDKTVEEVNYIAKYNHYSKGEYSSSHLPLAKLSIWLFILSFIFDIAALVFQGFILYPMLPANTPVTFAKLIHDQSTYSALLTVIGWLIVVVDIGLKIQLPLIKHKINDGTHATLNFLKFKVPAFAFIVLYFLNILNAFLWDKNPTDWWPGLYWFCFALSIVCLVVAFIMLTATSNRNYLRPLKLEKRGANEFKKQGGADSFEGHVNEFLKKIKTQ